jgi:hypothetical protein
MKEWCKKRYVFSHDNLLKELKVFELEDCSNFLRMNVSTYSDLLQMVAPQTVKEDTVTRNSIPASQRLSATLRVLATGQASEDLKFTTAIAPQTLSRIVLETYKVIIWALKDNIKIRNSPAHSKQFINLAICYCKYKLL